MRERYVFGIEALPDLKLKFPGPTPSSLQLNFCIYFEIHRKTIAVSADGVQTSIDEFISQPKTSSLWADNILFENNQIEAVYSNFSPKFTSLGIDSNQHQILVLKIIQKVNTITRSVPKRRKVMPLFLKIVCDEIHYVFNNTSSVLDRAIMASTSSLEYENGNYGMVPADSRSLRMVKIVEVGECEEEEEEAKNCSICLEEVIGFASAMPCSHVFHDNCIIKWLSKSHYCPVCRFEMPAEP